MKRLGFFSLRIKLLTSAIEVINNREDFSQGAAGDLQLQVVLIPALTFAEIVKVGRDAHVLTTQGFVFLAEGAVLAL